MKRIFMIVLDSFGVGEAPDAAAFGDKGANTLRSAKNSGMDLVCDALIISATKIANAENTNTPTTIQMIDFDLLFNFLLLFHPN